MNGTTTNEVDNKIYNLLINSDYGKTVEIDRKTIDMQLINNKEEF